MKPEQDKGSIWLCYNLKFASFCFFFNSKHAISSANAIKAILELPGMRVTFLIIYSVVLYELKCYLLNNLSFCEMGQ